MKHSVEVRTFKVRMWDPELHATEIGVIWQKVCGVPTSYMVLQRD
jgi:hypothetical protein